MDISWLSPVYEAQGPFATVHLDVSRNDENAAHEVELRWRGAREQLASAGAPDDLLDQIEPAALALPEIAGSAGRTIVATAQEGVLLDRAVPGPVQGSTTWGPLPDVVPLLRRLGSRPPYVLVLLDRQGADIEVWGPSEGTPRETETVKGGNYPIRKVKVGGWAHHRYQHRADNLWRDNAEKVAEDIERLVATTGTGLVAVAGDEQAYGRLNGALSERTMQMLVVLEHGSRAAGSDRELVDEEIEQLISQHEVQQIERVLEEFREQRGRGERAVEGVDATCDALRRAQVQTLLLVEDVARDQTVYVGSQAFVLGVTEDEVTALGDTAKGVDAPAGLTRAAAATDAAVVLVPREMEPLKDGVGAVLRYADESTPS